MSSHWILIANASHARLFARPSPAEPLAQLLTMRHARSRQKGVELAGDRRGREAFDHAVVHSHEPNSEARRREHERFAIDIVRYLHAQAVIGNLKTLWIFASNPFLGELKKHLSQPLRKALQLTLDSDLSALSLSEIENHLPRARPLPSPQHIHV